MQPNSSRNGIRQVGQFRRGAEQAGEPAPAAKPSAASAPARAPVLRAVAGSRRPQPRAAAESWEEF